jgi:hypothetical protein
MTSLERDFSSLVRPDAVHGDAYIDRDVFEAELERIFSTRWVDYTAAVFKRKRQFSEVPSAKARSRIKVSPFAGEPVGWIIDNVGPEMLVFASDYPHPEGASDPIKKFETTMQHCDQATMDAFYHGNMQSLMAG